MLRGTLAPRGFQNTAPAQRSILSISGESSFSSSPLFKLTAFMTHRNLCSSSRTASLERASGSALLQSHLRHRKYIKSRSTSTRAATPWVLKRTFLSPFSMSFRHVFDKLSIRPPQLSSRGRFLRDSVRLTGHRARRPSTRSSPLRTSAVMRTAGAHRGSPGV